jgi:hypothetical protein
MNRAFGVPIVIGCALLHGSAHLIAQTRSPSWPAPTADVFVGTWVLNLEKSTYKNMPAPKSGMRTFDYERDGLILCTAHAVSETGNTSFVHYLFTLDGREYEEVTRGSRPGRTPTFVSARKTGERDIEVLFKHEGKVIIKHEWRISDDGREFIVTRTATNAQGLPTHSVAVYEKK